MSIRSGDETLTTLLITGMMFMSIRSDNDTLSTMSLTGMMTKGSSDVVTPTTTKIKKRTRVN